MRTATKAPPSITPPPHRVRPWLWVLLGLALIAGAVAIVGVTTYHSTDFYEPTPQEVASGNQLVSALQVPAGATRDLYGTACGLPTITYCLTSTKATPEQLMDAVLGEARKRGASVKGRKCLAPSTAPADLPWIARCGATIHFHGAQVQVAADDEAMLSPHKTPTWILVIPPSTDTAIPSDGPTTPLGTWASLHLLPAGWTGTATCVVGSVNACTGYKLRLTRPGSVRQVSAALSKSISRAGYRLNLDDCQKAANSKVAICHVGAARFRAVGGRDEVTVIAGVGRAGATSTTVLLSVGDLPKPGAVPPLPSPSS